ncbi:MAG: dUTP diphosphatase [Clostridia bacterium]|nr:dUTP diphosphatase [Clostridia bacterium]
MEVKIKKLSERATTPVYASAGSAGADLTSAEETDITINPGETVFIGTQIAVEIPKGYVGLVYARSGLACKRGLAPANKVGVIDSDYRGEIKVALHNHGKNAEIVKKGERIALIVIAPCVFAEFKETEDLASSERGEGGFGSTGRL